jgi:hypothetical protein
MTPPLDDTVTSMGKKVAHDQGVARVVLLQEHGDIAASTITVLVDVPFVRVMADTTFCNAGAPEEDVDAGGNVADVVTGSEEEGVGVDAVFAGIVVLKIVSTTASTKVVEPRLEVVNVVNVEIGNTHSIVPVCNSTAAKPSASANPP